MPEDLPVPSVSPRNNQAEETATGPRGRTPDEIALDLMKFISVTTGYGRSGGSTAGFSGRPTARSPEEYAEALLQLFERCREVVRKDK
jgi:hypothetical protein